MELIVDGELNPVSVSEGATVADVLHLADEQLSQARRMIVSITIDGEKLPAERLSEYQPRDVSSIEKIEIGSQLDGRRSPFRSRGHFPAQYCPHDVGRSGLGRTWLSWPSPLENSGTR